MWLNETETKYIVSIVEKRLEPIREMLVELAKRITKLEKEIGQ